MLENIHYFRPSTAGRYRQCSSYSASVGAALAVGLAALGSAMRNAGWGRRRRRNRWDESTFGRGSS